MKFRIRDITYSPYISLMAISYPGAFSIACVILYSLDGHSVHFSSLVIFYFRLKSSILDILIQTEIEVRKGKKRANSRCFKRHLYQLLN